MAKPDFPFDPDDIVVSIEEHAGRQGVLVIHLPTGLAVWNSDGLSQHKQKEWATERLVRMAERGMWT